MHFTIKVSAAFCVAASFIAPVSATWVQQCYSRLFDQRADPILQSGKVAYHTHVIAGGNGFNFTIDYAAARASTCSSCAIKEDLSNYWTPKMYYHAKNGSFITVPIEGDDNEGNMGGMAIYYLHRPGPDNDPIVPFPKGFRMIAGNAMKRAAGSDFASLAVNHRCIGTDLQFDSLPDQKCPGGVRVQVTFPGCWDGKNLDSQNHQSHVAYPKDGNFDGGRCPSTHPKHIMTLFFEVTYRTDQFDDMWYDEVKQPFVFANGDPTGYGFHGDFINGWDIPTLQKAITNCVDGAISCPDQTFTYFDKEETQACKLPNMINEKVNGVLPKLVGCNPVTTDAAAASKAYATCRDKTIIGLSSTAGDVGGYKYIGCGTDPIMDSGRTLTGSSKTDVKMTPKTCVSFCKSQGYAYAGTEYGTECYCGNTLPSGRAPKTGMLGNCNMPCGGNPNVMCGGSQALSLYQDLTKKGGGTKWWTTSRSEASKSNGSASQKGCRSRGRSGEKRWLLS
ncbi:WSC-domain-containing protein [Saccharata proteae CBS 121410]|uniref:WSC-domain-containing protein n=1 Tax=Saccharata proteae CBS 121410 TaxID=1314787 RepID=A0A9P4LXK3_9PEZI|nr:WSC-domain-containing protein [Saccharata proteae CBS 121410]